MAEDGMVGPLKSTEDLLKQTEYFSPSETHADGGPSNTYVNSSQTPNLGPSQSDRGPFQPERGPSQPDRGPSRLTDGP